MLVIQCDTSRFRPGNNNGFKCNTCRQMALFPHDCTAVVIISIGTTHTTVLKDARTGVVLHDCRHAKGADNQQVGHGSLAESRYVGLSGS